MKEDKAAVKSSAGKENEPVIENATKKKTKEEKPPTKVVVRRLPPSMTEEQFKMQISPLPDYDYFYFVAADMSLMPNAFSRAYINFIDQNDLFIFTQKFDGYVFVDSKGGEFPAVVEFAPFQRIPKNRPNRKKDSKVGTIEADPIYIAFKERMEAENLENKTAVNTSKQHFFETSSLDKKEEVSNTPLLDYIRNKRAERQRIREEKREEKRKKDLERRRAKEEQRRVKKEDETSVVKNPSPVNPNPKIKEASIGISETKKNISSNLVEKKEEGSEGFRSVTEQMVETSKPNRNDRITKKVRELVDFFSKSANELKKDEPNKTIDTDLQNCIKHEDLERQMMKSVSDETKLTSKSSLSAQVLSPKRFTKPPMMNCNFKESSLTGPGYPIPVRETRGGLPMYVPRTPPRTRMYTRSNSDIVMRPVRVSSGETKESNPTVKNFVKECEIIRPARPIRVNIPVIQSNRRSCETYNQSVRKPFETRTPIRVNVPLTQDKRKEIKVIANNYVQNDVKANVYQKENEKTPTSESKNADTIEKLQKTTFPQAKAKVSSNTTENPNVKSVSSSEVLKKNLQKVIADVLGNIKVSNPKGNIINKPKTFVRRGYSGSGDECQEKGFNSPNFYLPPRAFGFGMGEVSNTDDKRNLNHDKFPNSLTSFTGKTQFSTVPKKCLPPFSKKSAYSSKSDGDIEKYENVTKAGGSEENLKKMPPHAFVVQRPYGVPRKPIIVEKNG